MVDYARKPTEQERADKQILDTAMEKANQELPTLKEIARQWVTLKAVNKGRPEGKLSVGWIGQLKDGAKPPAGFEATDGTIVTTAGPCKGWTKPTLEGCAIKVVKDW